MTIVKNKFLQKIIKKRGWITIFLILIFSLLLIRIVNELGVDYLADQYPKNADGFLKGAEPIYYPGNTNVGILLIHGFSSSPGDFKDLARFLAEKNLTVYAPLLPGHGTHPRNLKKIKYTEWQSAVEAALKGLNTQKKFVLGYSMGGTLALDLASKQDLDGVILINAALTIKNRWLPFLPLVKRIETYTDKSPEHIVEFINEKRTVYDSIPFTSIEQLLSLISKINTLKITEPILIFQSTQDQSVSPESAEYIFTNVASSDKQIVFLGNSTHSQIENQQIAFEKIYEFISTR